MKMENKEYKDMDLKELWQEIITLVNAANFTDSDKELFVKLIEEYGFRKEQAKHLNT